MKRRVTAVFAVVAGLLRAGPAAADCAFTWNTMPRAANVTVTAVKKAPPGCALTIDEVKLKGFTVEHADRVYGADDPTCKLKAGDPAKLELTPPCCDPGGAECQDGLRMTAVALSAEEGAKRKKAVEDKSNAKSDADVSQYAQALLALSLMGKETKGAVPLVKAALKRATAKKGKDTISATAREELRGAAALALLRLEPDSVRQLPQLYAWAVGAVAFGHADWIVLRSVSERRRNATKIIKDLEPYFAEGRINGMGPYETRIACMTLALLRDAGKPQLPAITSLLRHAATPVEVVRDCARAACAIANEKELEKVGLTPSEKRAYRCDPLVLDVPFVPEPPSAQEAAQVQADAQKLSTAKLPQRAAALLKLVQTAPPKEDFKP